MTMQLPLELEIFGLVLPPHAQRHRRRGLQLPQPTRNVSRLANLDLSRLLAAADGVKEGGRHSSPQKVGIRCFGIGSEFGQLLHDYPCCR